MTNPFVVPKNMNVCMPSTCQRFADLLTKNAAKAIERDRACLPSLNEPVWPLKRIEVLRSNQQHTRIALRAQNCRSNPRAGHTDPEISPRYSVLTPGGRYAEADHCLRSGLDRPAGQVGARPGSTADGAR